MTAWHVYDAKTLRLVEPRLVDGKSQADVAREISEALESHDIVIVEMPTGSGKTLTVLSACFNYCPDCKVVYNTGPYRARQVQVAKDFTERFLIGDGEKFWNFGIVWGRENYRCPRTGLPCSEAPCRDRSRRHEYTCYAPPVRGRHRVGERSILAEWTGIDGSTWCLPETDCPYYRQFAVYQNRDVVVMNSFMWLSETMLGRKVRAEVEIIDEFDAVLQEITPRIAICEQHLKELARLVSAVPEPTRTRLRQDLRKVRKLLWARRIEDLLDLVYTYQKLIDDLAALFPEEFTDDNVLRQCMETARKLRAVQLSIDSYVPVRKGDCLVLTCVDSEKHVRNILSMCGRKKILVSATPPPEPILVHVYGLQDYAYIKAGRGLRGTVYLGGTFEMYVSGRLLRLGKRDHVDTFRRALIETVRLARIDGYEPRLIVAVSKLHLDYLYIDCNVAVDWDGRKLQEFMEGKVSEVATTRAFRAVDLPGDMCRSIVITKAPFPDLEDPWWAAVSKKLERVGYTRDFVEHLYRQLTKHNLLQIAARALRSEDDWVWIYSPDRHVLELLLELEREGKIRLVKNIEPPTRRTVLEILDKVHREGIASTEVPDPALRSRIKHIVETWFSCVVYEAGTYIVTVHRARQHELEEKARQLIETLTSGWNTAPPTTLADSENSSNNSNNVEDSSVVLSSGQGSPLSVKEDLVLVFFRSDCPPYRRGDVAYVPRRLVEKCRDVEVHSP